MGYSDLVGDYLENNKIILLRFCIIWLLTLEGKKNTFHHISISLSTNSIQNGVSIIKE